MQLIEPAAQLAEGEIDENDTTVRDTTMEVPAGITGAIIGKAGAKINELKTQSGVEDIKMPERQEPKPRAREPVTLTIIGTASATKKAWALIEVIRDEWVRSYLPIHSVLILTSFTVECSQTSPRRWSWRFPTGW